MVGTSNMQEARMARDFVFVEWRRKPCASELTAYPLRGRDRACKEEK
jgi:hypothetical protein